MMNFDQYTRWQCPKCGAAGFDSWNKALFDGVEHEPGQPLPNPWILGDTCHRCSQPAVTCYTTPDAPPRAIFSVDGTYAYEAFAMVCFEANPTGEGQPLAPSDQRDGDWRKGCIAAQAPQP
jgi:hypothetical protein